MKTQNRNKTENIELAETDNIRRSINRANGPTMGCDNWRRALYHGFLMSNAKDRQLGQKLREALNLP